MFIQDWASVVVGSMQNLWFGFISTLASIVGALIILIIGLIVAAGIGALVEKLINFIKLDKLLVSLGVREYFERANMTVNSGKFFQKLVYWFLGRRLRLSGNRHPRLLFAFGFFEGGVLLYVPNVIVAILIGLAAFVIGHFLRNVVRAFDKKRSFARRWIFGIAHVVGECDLPDCSGLSPSWESPWQWWKML